MITSDLIASISAGIALISVIVSIISIFIAGKASSLNKKMFKRQGVIDLHMAWHGVNDIDLKNPICPDIIKAVNALDLTASLWNHDIVEKIILYQSYWSPYKNIYEKLNSYSDVIIGINKKGNDIITKEISRAFEDMKKFDLESVRQTSL